MYLFASLKDILQTDR